VEVGADRPLARYGRRGGSRPRGTWSWWAASDGEEALELLEGEPEGSDVVLVDLTLPEDDAIELTRRVAEEHPRSA